MKSATFLKRTLNIIIQILVVSLYLKVWNSSLDNKTRFEKWKYPLFRKSKMTVVSVMSLMVLFKRSYFSRVFTSTKSPLPRVCWISQSWIGFPLQPLPPAFALEVNLKERMVKLVICTYFQQSTSLHLSTISLFYFKIFWCATRH